MDYEIAANVRIARPPADVIGWLVTPERMQEWIIGVEARDDCAGGVIVEASAGVHFGHTYRGEIVEQTPDRVVRRYALAEMRGGVARMTPGADEYARTVTYDLAGTDTTDLTCKVLTIIPGLAKAAARAGARAETKSLEASLDRLRDALEGRRSSPLAGFRRSGRSAQPL